VDTESATPEKPRHATYARIEQYLNFLAAKMPHICHLLNASTVEVNQHCPQLRNRSARYGEKTGIQNPKR
jgi:hypothetical protein